MATNSSKPTKPRTLSPEAARILEQYRSAGKGIPAGADGTASPDGGTAGGAPGKPAGPPPAAQMRRSGSRGK